MLVNAKKLRLLRQNKNWTQQHLAEVCDLSLRTIQRVEKDGVAANETVAALAAIFELKASEIIFSSEQFEHVNQVNRNAPRSAKFLGALFFGGLITGIGTGIGLAMWLF